jgi:hypothetical protein
MRPHELPDFAIPISIPATSNRGVNPATAVALLMTTLVVSTITFFGAAYALLPVQRPAQAGIQAEPQGHGPDLRSDDGSSVVALGAADDAEAPAAPAAAPADVAPAGGRDAAPAAQGQGRSHGRQGQTRGQAAGQAGQGTPAAQPDRNLVRPGCRDQTDPLCGMEPGGGLDV